MVNFHLNNLYKASCLNEALKIIENSPSLDEVDKKLDQLLVFRLKEQIAQLVDNSIKGIENDRSNTKL